jgi:antidote-toxin recognition MazE-like antitoxin
MAKPIAERVKRRRDALRKSGLRPIQIWAPDSRRRGFAAECRRQSELVAEADRNDPGLAEFLGAALLNMVEQARSR